MNRSFPPTSGIGNRESGIGLHNPPPLPLSPSPPPRTGVTLTEVLMALMVMGIGVVSVITLFPVSLLRSVEATKITNATLAKQNAETRIEMSVGLRRDRVTNNVIGAIPKAILNDPDRDGFTHDHTATPGPENFVFDPLGAVILNADGSAPNLGAAFGANARAFGDMDGNGQLNLADGFTSYNRDGNNIPDPILRYTFGLNTLAEAEQFVTLPDSFITIFEGIAGTFTLTAGPPPTIAFTNPILGEYSVGQEIRLSAFNSGNQASAVFSGVVTDADGDTLGDTITLNSPIPAGLAPVDRVVVDIPERRYTWIATVRQNSSDAPPKVAVAVFFRRSFSPADEEVFILNEPPGTYNVFEMPLGDLPGSFGNDDIQSDGLGGWEHLPPGFEKGGWMLDLDEFRWWKITDIQERDVNNDGTVDGFRFATDPGEYDDARRRIPSAVHAIFPQNIIEVYTLDTTK